MPSGSILLVGDVHLGRSSSRVPELRDEGLSRRDLSPRAAFEGLVREARTRAVDAVVFLGDVVDNEDCYFEAWGSLHEGVRQLVGAGIAVYAVAGNHDVHALPRLADELAGFRLLGRGGRWEQALIERDGQTLARLVGWSFPRARVEESPLGNWQTLEPLTVPTLGLLHCDLDGHASPYAPVAARDLARTGLDAWILGHVHEPSRAGLAAARPLGYLGSLVGLDPTETGIHGPWLARIEDGRLAALEQLALAPLVWLGLEVDVSALAAVEELGGLLVAGLRERAAAEAARLGGASAVGCRVRLVGSHALGPELAREARRQAANLTGQRFALDGRVWFVEKVIDELRAAHDLSALARSADLPGLVARRLLALERDDEGCRELVDEARERLAALALRRPWLELDPGAPSRDATRELLLTEARETLDGLLAQGGAQR